MPSIVLLIIFLFSTSHPVQAVEQIDSQTLTQVDSQNKSQLVSQEDSTRWMLELPIWLPGFKGTVSYGDVAIDGGNETGIFDKIFDTSTRLDYYFVGKVRYSFNKWRIQADVFGGQIDNSVEFKYDGTTLVETKIETIIPRIYLAYQFMNYNFKKENAGTLSSYVYAGIKTFHVKIQSELPDPIPPIDLKSSWAEPLMGLILSYEKQKLTISTYAETALFKTFSTPVWWLQVNARYRVGHRVSLELGWIRQDLVRAKEVLGENLELKISLQGPLAGVAFHF